MTVFKNRKGISISFLMELESKEATTLVVLLPGFLDTKEFPHITTLTKELAQTGYLAISFDPTGLGKSGGKIEDYTCTQYLEDLEDIVRHFQNKFDYIKDIIVIGHSLGGIIASIYAFKHQNIALLIPIMSPEAIVFSQNYQERYIEWKKQQFKTFETSDPESAGQRKTINLSFDYVEDGLQYQVMDIIKKISAPIVFIAGSADTRVPTEHIRSIYEAANPPKKLIVLEGIRHNYRKEQNQIEIVNKTVLDTIKKYLYQH